MTPIRVLLTAMPPLLHDVLADGIASQPDLEVAGDVPRGGVVEAVERSGAGAVVTSTDTGALPENYRDLIHRFPRLKVVVLSADGRAASLYRLVLSRLQWTEISPQDVFAAIRHRDADFVR